MKLVMRNNEDRMDYPVKSDSEANLNNALDIWLKFTSSLKSEELLFVGNIKNKKISKLSFEDVQKFNRIKEQLEMSKLFVKYKKKECTKEEHDKVSNYMNNSLRDFVKSRVSEEEIESANEFVDELSKKSLEEFIRINQAKYSELDIYDAYVLFIAKERLHQLFQKEANQIILNDRMEKQIRLENGLKNYY